MTRTTARLAVAVASCLVTIGLYAAGPARGAPNTPWLGVAGQFAAALSAGDQNALATITTPEFHARLVAALGSGSGPRCGLSNAGLSQNGALLSSDRALVQLLCRHPDGVEEFVSVTLHDTGSGWRVCGGFVPR